MITNFHFKTIKYRKSFLWPDLSDSFKDSFHYKYSRVRNKRPRTLITVILEKILTKKCLFQPPILFRMEIFSTHPFSCGWKIKKVLYYYSYTNFFVCVFINLPDEYSIVRSWEINTPVSNQKNYRFSLLKFSKFSLLFLHENTVVIAIFSYFIVAFRHPLEISFLLCGNSCIRNATFELQMRFLNFEMFKYWYYQQNQAVRYSIVCYPLIVLKNEF